MNRFENNASTPGPFRCRRILIQSILFCLPLAAMGQVNDGFDPAIRRQSAQPSVPRTQTQIRQVRTPQIQLSGDTSPDPLIFVPVAPCRVADTRSGSGYPALGSTALAKYTPRNLQILGLCGTSSSSPPVVYSLTVTSVPPPNTPGYILIYPDPISPYPPSASFAWSAVDQYITGFVVVPASPDGSVNVITSNPTNVVIDINGYYIAPTDSHSDTAMGSGALSADTSGADNTAFGSAALTGNVNGSSNTAVGYGALYSTNGSNNTAVGYGALYSSSGNNNIGIGAGAGFGVTTGNDNILIGNQGLSNDKNTIRIGDMQTTTYLAGIWGNPLSDSASVFINAQGQLGVQPSSRRFKEDIRDMGNESQDIMRLRPVTFRYKKANPDGSKPLEFGLIAEEVAEVYPELVVWDQDHQPQSVQYNELPALLLNELQKQSRRLEEQDRAIQKLTEQLAALRAKVLGPLPEQHDVSSQVPDEASTKAEGAPPAAQQPK